MARDYESYMERAKALLAAGFPNKARRKEANEFASRAYEAVRDEMFRALCLVPHEERDEAWEAMSDACVFQLSQWRPKHAALLVDRFPEQVAKIQEASSLRGSIAAAPEAEKAPLLPKSEAQLAWKAEVMTCQICGRGICAKGGRIAHHGYERSGYGWQTASCGGAKELPLEADRKVLGKHIAFLVWAFWSVEGEIAKVEAGGPVVMEWRRVGERSIASRAFRDEADYEAWLASPESETFKRGRRMIPAFSAIWTICLNNLQQRRAEILATLGVQAPRFTNWKQTHTRVGKKWVAL